VEGACKDDEFSQVVEEFWERVWKAQGGTVRWNDDVIETITGTAPMTVPSFVTAHQGRIEWLSRKD